LDSGFLKSRIQNFKKVSKLVSEVSEVSNILDTEVIEMAVYCFIEYPFGI
jgi:hypothetical protein